MSSFHSLSVISEIRILHISDNHNYLIDPSTLPPADILIHTGDFSHRGKTDEFASFNHWLGEVAHLYPVRIVILGNHDVMVHGMFFDKMVEMLSNATHVPAAEFLEICGLRMLTLPYIRYDAGTLSAIISSLSQHRDIDLLLTHAPGYGVLDMAHNTTRCGSKAVKRLLLTVRPQCHLFGHVHEDYGFRQDGSLRILSVNSSVCDHPITGAVNRGHIIMFQTQSKPERDVSAAEGDDAMSCDRDEEVRIRPRLMGILHA